MATKIVRWAAADGSEYPTEKEANDHDRIEEIRSVLQPVIEDVVLRSRVTYAIAASFDLQRKPSPGRGASDDDSFIVLLQHPQRGMPDTLSGHVLVDAIRVDGELLRGRRADLLRWGYTGGPHDLYSWRRSR